MFDGMMRILSSSPIMLRLAFLMPDLPPIIAFISYLSFSIKVGKLKGAQLRVRLVKTSLNLFLSGITRVEGPTTVASTSKAGSWGRGNATTRASIIETRTPGSIRMETLLFWKWVAAPAITLGGVKSTWPLIGEHDFPRLHFLIGVLNPTVISSGIESSSINNDGVILHHFFSFTSIHEQRWRLFWSTLFCRPR